MRRAQQGAHTRWRPGQLLALGVAVLCSVGCSALHDDEASLSKQRAAGWRVGERQPNSSEAAVVGSSSGVIRRGTAEFRTLVRCSDDSIVFKDEEGTRADRVMSTRLRSKLARLAELVPQRFPNTKLRVTEAWDENGEHGRGSLHYEGRAADITTSDSDPGKLGSLAALAVSAGFDWVYFEDETHVHVSVKR